MSRKSVLLTNDDGICGEGLGALTAALSAVADVYVLAPDSNRSAVSSHLTMNTPLRLAECAPRTFACSGSPADCVIAALRSDLFGGVRFDAVLSGINKGANMGTDLVYSGTAAAARQAVLYGTPGIAVSLESPDGTWKFNALAEFCARNLGTLISLCSRELFVSVNACSSDKYKKVEFASLCTRDYRDMVSLIEAPDGVRYGFFRGGDVQSYGGDDADSSCVRRGSIAVSRVFAEPVCGPGVPGVRFEV